MRIDLKVTIVVDGKGAVTYRLIDKSAPQGSAFSVVIFLVSLFVNISALSWSEGFVDDISISRASKSILENIQNLEWVGVVAKEWEKEDGAEFEESKAELMHTRHRNMDFSKFGVHFWQLRRHAAGAFLPLDKINRLTARCITAALEKEAALLPAQLRIERDALMTVAYYLSLPSSHVLRSLVHSAIFWAPKSLKSCSVLHLVERIPG
ncbi:hypothetical protein C8F04DRAFT_1266217 [Mycena alexandri]|uniref:Reverse transcriptase domain-containing protein n=1 Tax=Mycena alexandri TaxID=1745969 RepID=A0AAD6SJN5_9AGAR|nr:hypothetical protein C8F04DRAFT_1266217 [Mycena alexandri]